MAGAFRDISLGIFGGPEKDREVCFGSVGGLLRGVLLSSESSGQLDVFGSNRHSFGMYCAEVRVSKRPTRYASAASCSAMICIWRKSWAVCTSPKILSDFPDDPLEWQLPNQELSPLLVSSYFLKGYSSRPVSMRFLHSSSGWCCLSGRLCLPDVTGLWLFTTSLISSSSLFCSRHFSNVDRLMVLFRMA